MKSLFGMLFLYLLFNALLIALGIGIGFFLHWILPAVEIGMSILIGVVASGISLHFGIRLNSFLGEYVEEELFIEEMSEITPAPPRQKHQRKKSK